MNELLVLPESEIEVGGNKVNSYNTLRFYVGDSYNGSGQTTFLPRDEAIKLVKHLIITFFISPEDIEETE